MLAKEIEKYVDVNTSNESECLYLLNRDTNIKITMPRMLSGKVQGKFLEMVSLMIKPKRILEIGTFTGYSAICLAKGLADGGLLYTIDSNQELEDMITHYFKLSGYNDSIKLIIGNALTEVPKIDEQFDLVFIDADKKEYIDYYKLAKGKLNPGGFILIDNVLWGGKVTKPKVNDKETQSIVDFNNFVAKDNDVEQVMLTVRDGLLLIHLKSVVD